MMGSCTLTQISRFLAITVLIASASVSFAAEPVKIAFVDTGNTGRSVTAEAIANQVISNKALFVAVISRGVDVDPFFTSPEANAATLLQQHGMNVAAHHAAQVTANDIKHADVVLTMTASHRDKLIALFPDARDKTFLLSEFATGKAAEIADAYGKPMAVYEEMYAQVGALVTPAIEKAIATYTKSKQ